LAESKISKHHWPSPGAISRPVHYLGWSRKEFRRKISKSTGVDCDKAFPPLTYSYFPLLVKLYALAFKQQNISFLFSSDPSMKFWKNIVLSIYPLSLATLHKTDRQRQTRRNNTSVSLSYVHNGPPFTCHYSLYSLIRLCDEWISITAFHFRHSPCLPFGGKYQMIWFSCPAHFFSFLLWSERWEEVNTLQCG
jgi:hypothetical protein